MMCAALKPCDGVRMAGMNTRSIATVAASSVAGNGVPRMGWNGVQVLGTESHDHLERSPSHADKENASNYELQRERTTPPRWLLTEQGTEHMGWREQSECDGQRRSPV